MLEIQISRVNLNRFRNIPECDQFKTQVVQDKIIRHSDIPVNDFVQLWSLYQRLPHEKLNIDPVDFTLNIDHRVYTEWCMSPGEGKGDWDSHRDYQGEGFTTFVDKEVHYELERPRSEKDRGTEEGYFRVRDRVLGGLALKAIELFSDWDEKTYPKDCYNEQGSLSKTNDTRNLRDNLADYIERYNSLREQSTQTQAA